MSIPQSYELVPDVIKVSTRGSFRLNYRSSENRSMECHQFGFLAHAMADWLS